MGGTAGDSTERGERDQVGTVQMGVPKATKIMRRRSKGTYHVRMWAGGGGGAPRRRTVARADGKSREEKKKKKREK